MTCPRCDGSGTSPLCSLWLCGICGGSGIDEREGERRE